MEHFDFLRCCDRTCRALLTKHTVRVLQLNAVIHRMFLTDQELNPDLFEKNFHRIKRHLCRLKNLEGIILKLNDLGYEKSVRYLKLMDDLCSVISPSVRISLDLDEGEDTQNFRENELQTLSNLPGKISSITGAFTNISETYFKDKVLAFTQLKSLTVSLYVDQGTNLEYMKLLSCLENLKDLKILLWDRSEHSVSTMNFHKYFSVPLKLETLGVEIRSWNAQHRNWFFEYPPDSENMILEFGERIKNLSNLQELKIRLWINPEDPFLATIYFMFISITANKPKLKTLELKISEEDDVSKAKKWLNINDLFSNLQSQTSLESLQEIGLAIPGISFADFSGLNNQEKLRLKKFTFVGKVMCFEMFGLFLQLIEPAPVQESYMSLAIYAVKIEEIDDLFKALARNLKLETVYAQIYTEDSHSEQVLEKVFDLIKKLKGPKTIRLKLPQLAPKQDSLQLILESLNASVGKLELFSIELGTDNDNNYPLKAVFTRDGRYYRQLNTG